MSAKISQKEYLKKYLSGDKKKKKKDKKLKTKATVKIIDDDVHENQGLEIDEELLLTGEDAPQIVGVINISGVPTESKWKSFGGIKKEEKTDDDLWGKKADLTNEKLSRNLSPKRKNFQAQRDTNQSSPRNKEKNNSFGRDLSTEKHSKWITDNSPPRKFFSRRSKIEQSPTRNKRDSDQSPPRKHSLGNSRKNSDQSPPRKRSPRTIRKDSDQSPQRNNSSGQTKEDSDQSPPRKRSIGYSRKDSDQSLVRRNSDQSPPRKRSPRRTRRDSDQSPPRKRSVGRFKKYLDQSPPRKNSYEPSRRDSDQSPPRRKAFKPQSIQSSSNHLKNGSEVRIKRENSADQSPPRRSNNPNPFKKAVKIECPSPDISPVNHNRLRCSESPPPTHKPSSKMTKTLDGKRAGLQDSSSLRSETEERRRNEDKMFSKMSKDISGRDAEVQVRKSSYRRHRKYEEEDPEVQRKKTEHEEKKKELYSRWNRGVKQIEAIQTKISEDQYESSKPLARYSNDADLDEMLRQKEREDDPMLEYIRSKRKDQQLAANVPVIPKYKGSYPENRFGIAPGYRWDGVDRSNGYEQKWFDVQSSKQAAAEEAYLYSVEDM